MKNKLTQNIGLKLISLVLAIGIWLIIIYTYDPADTEEFTLDVEILNEDAITSLNKVYEVIEGKTINIRVKGNTSVISNLKASDFRATADISKLSPTLHASINVVCTKSNGVEISFIGKVNMLAIRLEDIATKQFKVSVVQKGSPADGYYVGGTKTKPNLIQVSGAKSAIERINQVCTEVDVTGATEDFRVDAKPMALDENGKEITTGKLTYNRDLVGVAVTIYGTKEVPLEVIPEGEPYQGYRYIETEYEPKSVTVAGAEEVLRSLTSLPIPVNIAGRITDLEEAILLEDYLPEGVYLTDADSSVMIRVTIERLENRTFEIPYENIQLRGMGEDFHYLIDNEGSFTVKLSALRDELNSLEAISLRPFLDVGELSEPGNYNMLIQFELEEKYQIINSPAAVIVVEPKEALPPLGEEEGNKEEPEKEETEEGEPGPNEEETKGEEEPPNTDETQTPSEPEVSDVSDTEKEKLEDNLE